VIDRYRSPASEAEKFLMLQDTDRWHFREAVADLVVVDASSAAT
jgi:hypothetical protein